MKVVQPIEVIVFTLFLFGSSYSFWGGNQLWSIGLLIIGLLMTLLLVSYRLVSYIIAFLTEVAPSFSVVRDFLRKFGS
jgi:predicted branched-subunit amino acid permease